MADAASSTANIDEPRRKRRRGRRGGRRLRAAEQRRMELDADGNPTSMSPDEGDEDDGDDDPLLPDSPLKT